MNSRGHLSSQTLDLLTLSALTEPESQQARAHLDTCRTCQQAWEELEGDRQKFTQFVFPRTLPEVEARARRAGWWSWLKSKWSVVVPVAGLAVAAMVVMLVVPRSDQAPYYGLKGGARLDVVALRGDQQLPVGDDTALLPGDRIRFLVEPAGAKYVLVASRDGAGTVTLYYPFEGEESAALGKGFQELPGSIELDEVGGKEVLYAVFSDEPVKASRVREAIEQGADLSKLPGVRGVVTRGFVKEAR